ncbi:MFS transporter [Vineibacter terrae]|uniref:MFS transporter n=1 Tax=Vineibacter terrae TaxID=2586908 RepID=A0A5C8PC26_9HYPH|nr:MFS transporter [Vineibacter terrae]TXL71347.1 MFS transporter [Vineibacter terrae]
MMTLAMGMRQSLGLFQTPASQGLGIAVSDFALAVSIQQVAWGVTQPFVGALADRYGTRWVSLAGSIMYIAGLWLTATAQNATMIVLGAGVLIGAALSCTSSGITANIAARVVVPSRRTLAFGIVSAAGSLGALLTAPLAQFLLKADGWRVGLFAFVALALVMIPAALIGSRADKLPNSTARDRDLTFGGALAEAGRHPGYVVMACAYFVCGLQLVFLTTHLPTYLASCGMDPAYGAWALALIGGFNIISSWGFGWLGDRYPKRLLLGTLYLLRSLALASYFMFPPTPVSTLLFAAAMGLLWLGVIPLVNGLVAQIFGLRYLSTLTGVAFLSHQTGSFLGAWGGGYIFDLLGSYDLAWKVAVLIGLIAGTAQLLMDDRPTARVAAAQTAG